MVNLVQYLNSWIIIYLLEGWTHLHRQSDLLKKSAVELKKVKHLVILSFFFIIKQHLLIAQRVYFHSKQNSLTSVLSLIWTKSSQPQLLGTDLVQSWTKLSIRYCKFSINNCHFYFKLMHQAHNKKICPLGKPPIKRSCLLVFVDT